ncbi:MAG: PAS domain S-box protein [Methanomicrobiales archaeon]|nr:PAS domain S-box protein [Methanomicrobiales archaeon]
MNLMVFVDENGKIIYSESYDIQNKVMRQVPDFFSTRLDSNHPLMNMSDPHVQTAGFLILPEDILLVSSQPIIYSDYSGQAKGVFIIGKYLNIDEVNRIGTLTQPGIRFHRIDNNTLSRDIIAHIKDNSEGNYGYVQALNFETVQGYILLKDIQGNDGLVLQITKERDIFNKGFETTIQVLLIILTGSLILGMVLIFFLNSLIIKRVDSIACQVKKISNQTTLGERITLAGDDELSGLADEINRMLETIEQTQKKLQESEYQFRDLVESLPDYIVVYGKNKNIIYINPAAARAIGYEPDAMIGLPVMLMIGQNFRKLVTRYMKKKGNRRRNSCI